MSTNAVPANVLADMQAALKNKDVKEVTQAPFDATVAWFTHGKDYQAVADALKITKGRAAEYVRRVLVASGHADLTPRGANGAQRGGGVRKVSDAEAQIEALLEQAREQVANLQQGVTEARAAAEGFDPDQWRTEQITAMEAQVAELQARLDAWQTDADEVGSKAATEEQARLVKRADEMQGESEQQLAIAEANVGKFEQMLALMQDTETAPTGGTE